LDPSSASSQKWIGLAVILIGILVWSVFLINRREKRNPDDFNYSHQIFTDTKKGTTIWEFDGQFKPALLTHSEDDFISSVNKTLNQIGLGRSIRKSVPVKEKVSINEPEAYQWPSYPLGNLQIEVGVCKHPENRNYKCIQRVKLTPSN